MDTIQVACEKCNYRAGYYNYMNWTEVNSVQRLLEEVKLVTELQETSDIVAIKIGRAKANGQKTNFLVTAETMNLNNKRYNIKT